MAYDLGNEMPELLTEAGDSSDIGREWAVKRADILDRLMRISGGLPERGPVAYEVISETTAGNRIKLSRIVYRSSFGDQVPANLLIPAAAEHGKCPAVIALHQTVPEGKEEVSGIAGDKELAYGLELAERGFVVLAPDVLSAGERVYPGKQPFQTAPFQDAFPEWSMIGKMMTDHLHGVDLLCSLDIVDGSRIGAIGHSLGGYNSFFLSAVDERVRAIVVSCGLSTFAGDPLPSRWELRKEWFTHFPALDLSQGKIPFEFNEIVALTFPRPAFIWYTQNDAIFPHWEAIGRAVKSVADLYGAAGQGDRFTGLMGGGKHEFPRMIRGLAYGWLEQQLNVK